ncbi:MAG: hypothetical protein Q7S40_29915 [Opitutaceae bacterium]|nr:hypothetical protein [Opitutaceae bacterium]
MNLSARSLAFIGLALAVLTSGTRAGDASPSKLAQDGLVDVTAALVHLALGPGEGMHAPLLHWRTGRNSCVRSIHLQYGRGYAEDRPVRVTDSGGGRWYSLFKAARMSIIGTTEPLDRLVLYKRGFR